MCTCLLHQLGLDFPWATYLDFSFFRGAGSLNGQIIRIVPNWYRGKGLGKLIQICIFFEIIKSLRNRIILSTHSQIMLFSIYIIIEIVVVLSSKIYETVLNTQCLLLK